MQVNRKHSYDLGPFTLNASDRTLSGADGREVDVSPKAFEVLQCLIQRRIESSGSYVSRDDFKRLVWGGTSVSENSLDQALSELRDILGGSYIQNRRGLGWRLAVDALERFVDATERPPVLPDPPPPARLRVVLVLGITTAAALVWMTLRGFETQPRITAYRKLTNNGFDKEGPLVTDGAHLYYIEMRGKRRTVVVVPVAGGDPKVLDVPLDQPYLLDATKDGRKFLATDVTGMLWTWSPIDGLDPTGVYPDHGRISPDGRMIALSSGHHLLTIDATFQVKHKSAPLPGNVRWPDWSPDGNTLRFSVPHLKDGTESLWEVNADLSNPRIVLGPSKEAPRICCGTWTSDGRYYVFEGYESPSPKSDLWIIPEKRILFERKPIRLSNGPIRLSWPRAAPDDSPKLFAVGETSRGELVKFDRTSQTFTLFFGGIPAVDVSFSNDGQWAAYARYPEQTLWKSKADGSEALQVTKGPLVAFQPHWSPDGRQIAFMGQMPGKPWKAYAVDAGGGMPREMKPDDPTDQGVPTWARDGRSIVFGELLFRKPDSAMAIHVVEVAARTDMILPDSEGKWTPRWSPDGKSIIAQSPNGERLFLYDCGAKHWSEILHSNNIHDPTWSLDSEFVYFAADPKPYTAALYRIHIADRQVEQLVSPQLMPPMEYQWSGVAPDGSPLMLRSIKIQEIYGIDLALP